LPSDQHSGPSPDLPPIYRLVQIPRGPAFPKALEEADAGAGPGTVVWSVRPDRLDCAIVLAPDEPLAVSLPVAYVALLGLGDALGALGPPNVPVTFGWPDRIEVNGAEVGGIRLAAAPVISPAAIPDWMVIGIAIRILGEPNDDSPGLHPHRTALHEEGFGEVEAMPLLESFSRHFLAWMNRWQEDGFDPVRNAWLSRASGHDGEIKVERGGRTVTGSFTGIDSDGALLLGLEDGIHRVPLGDALAIPTWSWGMEP